MMNTEQLKNIINTIDEEIAILKTVLENTVSEGYDFCPMLIFYKSPSNKELVVAPQHFTNFQEKMTSIAEALHLYASINATAVIVALASNIISNETKYEALTLSILSSESAHNITLPYIVKDTKIEWQHHMFTINQIDSEDVDETTRDIITMFYVFTHTGTNAFDASEILSYLSSKGAAIEFFGGHYTYLQLEEQVNG